MGTVPKKPDASNVSEKEVKELLDAPEAAHDELIMGARWRRSQTGSAGRSPVDIGPTHARGLEAIAAENAVEGCTRERFGAAVAQWQAETASDDCIRRTMRGIAADELRHAELSSRS